MKLTRSDLEHAVDQGLLSAEQASALWAFWEQSTAPGVASFKAAHILYYLGGLIAIGAMTLFMNLGWERFGGTGLMAISLVYAVLAIALTVHFRRHVGLSVPTGIAATLAVAMVPLFVYGLQTWLGFWPMDDQGAYRDYHRIVDWRWVMMELATLLAAVLALWRLRLPFLVMPVALTLWYLSMDLVAFGLGGSAMALWSNEGLRVSLAFGLVITLLALWVDLFTAPEQDFAFWLYLFGVLAFWGAFSALDASSESGKLLYALVNVLMIGMGAVLVRRVFVVLGGLGLSAYLAHLSYTVFEDSLLFPLALTAIGLAIMVSGVYWQRHEHSIARGLRGQLPIQLRRMLDRRDAER